MYVDEKGETFFAPTNVFVSHLQCKHVRHHYSPQTECKSVKMSLKVNMKMSLWFGLEIIKYTLIIIFDVKMCVFFSVVG